MYIDLHVFYVLYWRLISHQHQQVKTMSSNHVHPQLGPVSHSLPLWCPSAQILIGKRALSFSDEKQQFSPVLAVFLSPSCSAPHTRLKKFYEASCLSMVHVHPLRITLTLFRSRMNSASLREASLDNSLGSSFHMSFPSYLWSFIQKPRVRDSLILHQHFISEIVCFSVKDLFGFSLPTPTTLEVIC